MRLIFSGMLSLTPCGGLWEASVKSAKSHMKRVIGAQLQTYEEFNTLVIQIERVMN